MSDNLPPDPISAREKRARLVVMVLHQVFWFITVWRVAAGEPLLGALAMGGFTVFAIGVLPRRELIVLVVAASLVGFLIDTSLVLLGAIAFPERVQLITASPLWMVALWAGFGVALALPLKWMLQRPVVGVVAGGRLAPLAYRGGASLEAIELPLGTTSLLAVGVGWAIAIAVLAVTWRGFGAASE